MTAEQLAAWEPIVSPPSFNDAPRPDFIKSLSLVRGAYGPLGNLPLTVLTATRGFDELCDVLPCPAMQQEWLAMQDEYAELSSESRHVEVDTGHYIQDEEPDLVVSEILALLDRLHGTSGI
jgi:hypothetical protein